MNVIYDLIFILIILIFGAIGYSKGFVATLFGFFKWFIAMLAATMLAGVVAGMIFDNIFAPQIEKRIEQTELAETATTIEDIAELAEKFEILQGNETVSLSLVMEKVDEGMPFEKAVCEVLIKPIQMSVIRSVCFTVIFASVFAICIIIEKLLRKANKLFLIGKVNAILGVPLGVAQGGIIACLYAFVLTLAAMIINVSFLNSGIIDKTVVIDAVTNFLTGGQ